MSHGRKEEKESAIKLSENEEWALARIRLLRLEDAGQRMSRTNDLNRRLQKIKKTSTACL